MARTQTPVLTRRYTRSTAAAVSTSNEMPDPVQKLAKKSKDVGKTRSIAQKDTNVTESGPIVERKPKAQEDVNNSSSEVEGEAVKASRGSLEEDKTETPSPSNMNNMSDNNSSNDVNTGQTIDNGDDSNPIIVKKPSNTILTTTVPSDDMINENQHHVGKDDNNSTESSTTPTDSSGHPVPLPFRQTQPGRTRYQNWYQGLFENRRNIALLFVLFLLSHYLVHLVSYGCGTLSKSLLSLIRPFC